MNSSDPLRPVGHWSDRFNPFFGLPRSREVFAWGMYDLANQSFQLLIKTLLFSLYVTDVVGATQAQGKGLWTAMSASSMLLVAFLSPILGSLADRNAWRREMLLVSGVVCSILTALLVVIGPGDVVLCFLIYLPAALACGLGENFLGAFLPEISTQKNIGYVSAVGWTMSYVGALVLLLLTALYAFVLGYSQAADFRPIFVFSGVWFLAGMLPAFLWLRERTPPTGQESGLGMISVMRQMWDSLKEATQYRQLMRFFATFFTYNLGTLAVVNFLGIIGNELGFALGELMLLAVVMTISAGIASATTARFQDRIGHKRTVMAFLLFWIGAMLGIAGTQYFQAPAWTFWIISSVAGLALGGLGTSTRALAGAFTPAHRSAQFFGVWGMVGQTSGILGVVAFGVVTIALGQVTAILMLAVFFTGGLVLMSRIDMQEGLQVARDAEIAMGIPDVTTTS
jgi:UMF1 family MFS transporter